MRLARSLLFLFALSPFVAAVACGSKAGAVGQGGQCEVATDCADGLVCIPQKDGTRVCSSDLSQVQHVPSAATPDAAGRASPPDSGSSDGSGDDGGSTTGDSGGSSDAAGD